MRSALDPLVSATGCVNILAPEHLPENLTVDVVFDAAVGVATPAHYFEFDAASATLPRTGHAGLDFEWTLDVYSKYVGPLLETTTVPPTTSESPTTAATTTTPACEDDINYEGAFGDCASYAQFGLNENLCRQDGVCDICCASCAAEAACANDDDEGGDAAATDAPSAEEPPPSPHGRHVGTFFHNGSLASLPTTAFADAAFTDDLEFTVVATLQATRAIGNGPRLSGREFTATVTARRYTHPLVAIQISAPSTLVLHHNNSNTAAAAAVATLDESNPRFWQRPHVSVSTDLSFSALGLGSTDYAFVGTYAFSWSLLDVDADEYIVSQRLVSGESGQHTIDFASEGVWLRPCVSYALEVNATVDGEVVQSTGDTSGDAAFVAVAITEHGTRTHYFRTTAAPLEVSLNRNDERITLTRSRHDAELNHTFAAADRDTYDIVAAVSDDWFADSASLSFQWTCRHPNASLCGFGVDHWWAHQESTAATLRVPKSVLSEAQYLFTLDVTSEGESTDLTSSGCIGDRRSSATMQLDVAILWTGDSDDQCNSCMQQVPELRLYADSLSLEALPSHSFVRTDDQWTLAFGAEDRAKVAVRGDLPYLPSHQIAFVSWDVASFSYDTAYDAREFNVRTNEFEEEWTFARFTDGDIVATLQELGLVESSSSNSTIDVLLGSVTSSTLARLYLERSLFGLAAMTAEDLQSELYVEIHGVKRFDDGSWQVEYRRAEPLHAVVAEQQHFHLLGAVGAGVVAGSPTSVEDAQYVDIVDFEGFTTSSDVNEWDLDTTSGATVLVDVAEAALRLQSSPSSGTSSMSSVTYHVFDAITTNSPALSEEFISYTVAATLKARSLGTDEYCAFQVSTDDGVTWLDANTVVTLVDGDDELQSKAFNGVEHQLEVSNIDGRAQALALRLVVQSSGDLTVCYLSDFSVTGLVGSLAATTTEVPMTTTGSEATQAPRNGETFSIALQWDAIPVRATQVSVDLVAIHSCCEGADDQKLIESRSTLVIPIVRAPICLGSHCITVWPTEGMALSTLFEIRARGWLPGVPGDSQTVFGRNIGLPLRYQFFVSVGNAGFELPLHSGLLTEPKLRVQLPWTGLSDTHVGVYVFDASGAVAKCGSHDGGSGECAMVSLLQNDLQGADGALVSRVAEYYNVSDNEVRTGASATSIVGSNAALSTAYHRGQSVHDTVASLSVVAQQAIEVGGSVSQVVRQQTCVEGRGTVMNDACVCNRGYYGTACQFAEDIAWSEWSEWTCTTICSLTEPILQVKMLLLICFYHLHVGACTENVLSPQPQVRYRQCLRNDGVGAPHSIYFNYSEVPKNDAVLSWNVVDARDYADFCPGNSEEWAECEDP